MWLTTSAGGGDPLPLSFGDFDVTAAHWSSDGRSIAYISNENGDTELWVQGIPGGVRNRMEASQRQYLHAMGRLERKLVDAAGRKIAARVSTRGSDGRSYAPDHAWVHADDGFDRFPYATTNPVFVIVDGQPLRSAEDAEYFLHWISRARKATVSNMDYNTEAERDSVLANIDAARAIFESRR